MHKIVMFFSVMFFLAGCNKSTTDKDEIELEGDLAYVVTSDFQSGASSLLNLDTYESQNSFELIHQDAICRFDEITENIFIVARKGSDAISIVSPNNGWRVKKEYSTGAGSNPGDIAVVSETKAYVSLYSESFLLIINPATGEKIGEIDLASYADDDGNPEVRWLQNRDGKVVVLLQRLKREEGFIPSEYSQLLSIDAKTDKVEKELKLSFTNPAGKLRYNKFIEQFVIIGSGTFGEVEGSENLDGGIEYYDPLTSTLSDPVVTSEDLGGDIIDAVIVSNNKGYAIIGVKDGDNSQTHMVSFNPATSKKMETLLNPDGWVLNSLELSPEGLKLLVSDGTPTDPGVRFFDTKTDEQLRKDPVGVGLPPFMVCFANGSDGVDTNPQDDSDSEDVYEPYVFPKDVKLMDVVVETPCADTEQSFGDPAFAVNGVHGSGFNAGGNDVFSLRYCEDTHGQFITLRVDGMVVKNGEGTDFVVYENAFSQSDESQILMEQMVVYLSRDNETWVEYPFDYTNSDETEYSNNPDHWQGFAGVQPTLFNAETNIRDPFDFDLSGGDHFDLSNLGDDEESMQIKQNGFTYLKLVQASSVTNPDTTQPFLIGPFSFDQSADIDGIYTRHTTPE